MGIIVQPAPGRSGSLEGGRLRYRVFRDDGLDLEVNEAILAAAEVSPPAYGGGLLTGGDADEVAGTVNRYDVTISYGDVDSRAKNSPPVGGDAEFSFSSTIEMVRRRFSIATIQAAVDTAVAGDVPPYDFGGAIGVDEQGRNPEGVDVPVAIGAMSCRFRIAGVITPEYARLFDRLAGKVNSDPFFIYDPGEARFDGARQSLSFSGGGEVSTELQFDFAIRPNQEEIVIGGMTLENVEGWDHVWPHFLRVKNETTGALEIRPAYAYVERVIHRAAFAALAIPGA